ncbi:MAG: C10 family peptidase, partial [Candidatus Omnitrophica bacterium]|nr:C10 family peptidase [Candidatus Omnitrophota bacterium]
FNGDEPDASTVKVAMPPTGMACGVGGQIMVGAMTAGVTSKTAAGNQPLSSLAAQNQAKWEEILGEGPYAARVAPAYTPAGTPLVEPMLETTWDQCRHYNRLCPTTPDALPGYDGRVPCGCVATAAAQMMKYHEWPPYGTGMHCYSDDHFEVQGYHSVDFSNAYDWANMKDNYDPSVFEPVAQVMAVADLLYELGVSVDMDYEADGSGAYLSDLLTSLSDYFYYDLGDYLEKSNPNEFDQQLKTEIVQRNPTVLGIPGHAVVADGLSDEYGLNYYHINYGWGGVNNNWYQLENLNGEGVDAALVGVQPRFMPLFADPTPVSNATGTFTLAWTFPQRLLAKVTKYRLLQNGAIVADNIPPGTNSWILQRVPAGKYDYVLQANDGSRWRESSPAKSVEVLAVIPGPTIMTQPQSQSVFVGATVTLHVTASGTGPVSYQWRRDGADIPGADSDSFTLAEVKESDSGKYTVVVTDSQGWVLSQTAVLLVTPAVIAPTIICPPTPQAMPVGGIATFTVLASGSSPLNYQWQFNGVDLPGATGATCLLPGVQTNNAGNYTVEVRNQAGSVTSAAAVLTVLVPPSITIQPESRTVVAGDRMSFAVAVAGTAPLRYQWYLNSSPIPGATSSSYTLSVAQLADSGSYKVRVSNLTGTVESAVVRLFVTASPLLSLTASTNGTVLLNMIGPAGKGLTLYSSPDLINWVPMITLPNPQGAIQYRDNEAGSLRSRFYKVKTE